MLRATIIKTRKLPGLRLCVSSAQGLAPRGNVSETINMRFKHVLGLLCAASISVALAATASAEDKTVKIGAIYPFSGNAPNTRVHTKAALETAGHLSNNA